MCWRNADKQYGIIAKGFHWLVAGLVIGLLCLGFYMMSLERSPTTSYLFFLHKSFGVTVLMLMVLRLGWRFANIQPAALPRHKPWEKRLARAIVWFFYAALILMPLSGWLMSSAHGYPVSVFKLFTLPDLVPEDHDLSEFLEGVHGTLAWIVIGVLIFHVAGVLKHHIMDKDSTLRRMIPFGKVE